MGDFIRARSAEQKRQRLGQIEAAARAQLEGHPYHEITLATIAGELGWSRASLYTYVTTKEEVLLLLAADERDAYYDALLAAMPAGCGLAPETVAEVWAGIANAHRGWFRLSHLLLAIIETNVGVERLVDFKRGHFERLAQLQARLSPVLGVEPDEVEPLLDTVSYHAEGLVARCETSPLVAEALGRLGRKPPRVDFRAEMARFIGLCLDGLER